MDDNTVFNLEEGLKRLSEINASLSSEDITLSDAMKLYEEGVILSKKCKDSLEDTKKKIIEITPDF